MDKRKLMLIGAAICALAALAGVVYIAVRKGRASGAVAFIPAIAAFLLYNGSRGDGGEDKKDGK